LIFVLKRRGSKSKEYILYSGMALLLAHKPRSSKNRMTPSPPLCSALESNATNISLTSTGLGKGILFQLLHAYESKM
jgi:hypothetical protein